MINEKKSREKEKINSKIGPYSNELELGLEGVTASEVIKMNSAPITPEVNTRDVIELNISLKKDLKELNTAVEENLTKLSKSVKEKGGSIYGGAILLKDVSGVEPARYRTTSLSESCGRGFLDILSQQLVLGVKDDVAGFEIYNALMTASPIIHALSASAPYDFKENNIMHTAEKSTRPTRYRHVCKYFPDNLWKNAPELKNLKEFNDYLKSVSDEVIRKLEANELDANWDELKKLREDSSGKKQSHYPFSSLNDSQTYLLIRPRPSHETFSSGGDCSMSMEFRVMDMPVNISGVKNINSLLVGLSNYIVLNGGNDINNLLKANGGYDVWREFEKSGYEGLEGTLNGIDKKFLANNLLDFSSQGLLVFDYVSEQKNLENYVSEIISGRDQGTLFGNQRFKEKGDAIRYLSDNLLK